jgi:DNA-binding PadR family transcriptional regulator
MEFHGSALIRRRERRPLPAYGEYVLLALANGPLHGGAARNQVIADTVGEYVPDTTLYRLLDRLEDEKLIERMPDMERWRLTAKGRDRLRITGSGWRRLGQLAGERVR